MFSMEVLEEWVARSGQSLKVLRLSGRDLKRFRLHGLDADWADRIACDRFGCHPSAIWPDWYDVSDPDPDDGEGFGLVEQLTLSFAAA